MKLKLFFLLICFGALLPQSKAEVAEHFDAFYQNYVDIHKIDAEDREVLNLMNKISNEKFKLIESYLLNSNNKQDRHFFINLINEEYRELLENLNFELFYVPHCTIKPKCYKKIKKAQRKYMRHVEKCYS